MLTVIALLTVFLVWNISFYWVLFPVFLWLVLIVVGSFHVRWNYFLPMLHRNAEKVNSIAISFDDGPHPEFTPKVLQLLKQHQAQATFFCIGEKMLDYPDLAQQIIAEGHCIGNHTYSHDRTIGFWTKVKVERDLEKALVAGQVVLGKKMRLFRPAFGVTNPNIAKATQQLQLQTIGWSHRTYDTTKRSKERIVSRLEKRIRAGDIVLLHDTSEKSVAVLEQLLLMIKKKNWKAVTVSQLLDIKAYD
ncbi:MAG: polysaccharide deacetylase family protein [Flavobacteriaceae bacterium]|nr:polysaccharide deacetylase family protein [Flavobacteriaceae bacterium]